MKKKYVFFLKILLYFWQRKLDKLQIKHSKYSSLVQFEYSLSYNTYVYKKAQYKTKIFFKKRDIEKLKKKIETIQNQNNLSTIII